MNLEDTLKSIRKINYGLEPVIHSRLDNLTKPKGSLGRLEEIAARYCLINGTAEPELGKKRIYTFAGDHGVTAEGVSAYPSEVTCQMVMNMLSGGAAVNVLARHAGAEVLVLDMGVNDPLEDAEGLIRRKIRFGTGNIAREPALSREEAVRAIETGIEMAEEAKKQRVTLLGTGEMGIGNTTPSSALCSVFLSQDVEALTGKGTGIDEQTLLKKINVIRRAIKTNAALLTDPLGVLAALGGLEIAGICGLCIGAASCRIPVVIDGFISSAGALAACRMCEEVKDYLYFSHCSDEQGHRVMLRQLGVQPILDLGMRLGEGTGAALAMQIIEASVKIYIEMATFDNAGVSKS